MTTDLSLSLSRIRLNDEDSLLERYSLVALTTDSSLSYKQLPIVFTKADWFDEPGDAFCFLNVLNYDQGDARAIE